ncbi:MAG: DUF4355 domain-containing protein [Desulfurellales bacterium]|nr:MAG: DUF4355 domain-containing protein [Desulfurellales bacterium]
MLDEQGEMPTTANGEMSDAPTIDLQKELDQTRAALKKANAEAASKRKLLETIEAERKAQAEAELSEMDKLRKELAETKQRATALELSQRKAAIAAEAGLPPALANRLQGETDEEMRADAEAILALIPQATATKQPPQLKPTNMAGASEVTETREQRLKRLGFA